MIGINKYQELLRKLQLIEAVYLRPGTEGEKQAAALAIQRIRQRIAGLKTYERAVIRKPEFTIFQKV